jgi:hypothetical protein
LALLFFTPYSGQGITGDTYVIAAAMGLLALLVIWAALSLNSINEANRNDSFDILFTID